MSIWILTSEYNEYDQYGAYFEDAWHNKPTRQELEKTLKDINPKDFVPSEALISHILEGGGRQRYEGMWYNLFKHK